jgi:hypothetical protein
MFPGWMAGSRWWWALFAGGVLSVACAGCLTARAVAAAPLGLALVPITLPIDLAVAVAADAAEHHHEEEDEVSGGPIWPHGPAMEERTCPSAAADTRPAPPPDLMENLDWVRACEGPDGCAAGTIFSCTGRRGACRCTCVADEAGEEPAAGDGAR